MQEASFDLLVLALMLFARSLILQHLAFASAGLFESVSFPRCTAYAIVTTEKLNAAFY